MFAKIFCLKFPYPSELLIETMFVLEGFCNEG